MIEGWRGAALVLALCLAACGERRGEEAPSALRFECAEGCGTYKTVRAGETPPGCCGVAMEAATPPAAAGD